MPTTITRSPAETIFWQEEIEKQFSHKHIDAALREEFLNNPIVQEKIRQGMELFDTYRSTTYSYASKNRRMAQLQALDAQTLVLDVFVGMAYCLYPMLFVGMVAQLANRLKFSDQQEGIQTMAELLAVLCATDAYDIAKPSTQASLQILSRLPLTPKLQSMIENAQVLPPMICAPQELSSNYSSGYLLHNDSLVLGTGNHHEGDLCLDVLNKVNQVALQLDLEFLSQVEEEPTFDLDTQDKWDQWFAFKKQSYSFYKLITDFGNQFWLTHKVDKRGRIYAQGYHISTQGTSFKKSAIELANEEFIDVPLNFGGKKTMDKLAFKLIIAGGRDFTNYTDAKPYINQFIITELKDYEVSIVSGMARGADAIAVQFAREHNMYLHKFPADWNTYGKSAGYRRNAEMAVFADGLLAFWDGQSRGTKHMIETMTMHQKPVRVVRY